MIREITAPKTDFFLLIFFYPCAYKENLIYYDRGSFQFTLPGKFCCNDLDVVKKEKKKKGEDMIVSNRPFIVSVSNFCCGVI